MKSKKTQIFRHKSNGLFVMSLCITFVFISHLINQKSSIRYLPDEETIARLDSIVDNWNKKAVAEVDTTKYKFDNSAIQKSSFQKSLINIYPENTRRTILARIDSAPSIDLNIASSEDLKLLPGIGDVLSKRIVTFRDKLGGFVSVEQCKLTYGLPSETFDKIKSRLKIQTKHSLIPINTADSTTLANHLYIMPWMASKIIRHRNWNGKYQNLEEFNSRLNFYPETIEKLGPYLQFE